MLLRLIKNFYRNLKYYFGNISVHGLCSIFKSSHLLEMLFWIFIFMFGLIYFYGLLYQNLVGFYYQPVTKSIDTTAFPVALVPFPAVTFCNMNVAFKYRTNQIVALLLKNGIKIPLIMEFFFYLTGLRGPLALGVSQFQPIYKIFAENGLSNHTKLMQDLAQPCERMFQSCSWAGTEVDCKQIFQSAKAGFGFCCSFNSDLDPVPGRLNDNYFTSAGPFQALSVKFNIETEEYLAPIFTIIGILIIVHPKNAYANGEFQFNTFAQPGNEVALKIVPEIIEAEHELNQVAVSARNCWLDSEGTTLLNLKYNFYNCMHICKSKFYSKMCDCIPYYHRDYDNVRSCTILDMPCHYKQYDKFVFNLNYKKLEENENITVCDCLAPCNDIKYDGSTELIYYKDKTGKRQTNTSGARVYFKTNFCTKYILSRTVTFDSLIALIGGLFALCLGGSLVSICEFIYFLFKSIFKNNDDTNSPSLYWSEFGVFQKHPNNKTNILFSKNKLQWNSNKK